MNAKMKAASSIMLVMIVLMIVGLVMVFTAHEAGERAGRAAMDANGGSMDTQMYYAAMQDGTNEALAGGGIMALIGGGGLLVCLKSRLDEMK